MVHLQWLELEGLVYICSKQNRPYCGHMLSFLPLFFIWMILINAYSLEKQIIIYARLSRRIARISHTRQGDFFLSKNHTTLFIMVAFHLCICTIRDFLARQSWLGKKQSQTKQVKESMVLLILNYNLH